jgi:hypothetical protein
MKLKDKIKKLQIKKNKKKKKLESIGLANQTFKLQLKS